MATKSELDAWNDLMLVGSSHEDTETELWAMDDQKQQSGLADRMTRLRFSTTMSYPDTEDLVRRPAAAFVGRADGRILRTGNSRTGAYRTS